MKNKVVALICARAGSKGIPNKAMTPLFRRPLIEYSLQTAKKASVHEVWVSSDSDMILNFAKNYGCFTIKRPDKLATDTASIESVILHFTENVDYSYLVLIQPTSPLVLPQHINRGLTEFFKVDGKYDSAFSVYSMEKNDILFWDKETMTPVNYNHMKRGIRQERKDKYYVETGGFYVTTKAQFLESKCRIGKKPLMVEVPFWSSFEIDTPEDLKNVEKLIGY
jgi:CMP-N,N'-diacetyllegionaminic acid synthase